MELAEYVAREICRAEGDDPDARVLLNKELARTRMGCPIVSSGAYVECDGWQLYLPQAHAAIAAVNRPGP